MARAQAGIGGDIPLRRETVGVHHEDGVVRAGRGKLLDLTDRVTNDPVMRNHMPGFRVYDHGAADVADAGEATEMLGWIELAHGDCCTARCAGCGMHAREHSSRTASWMSQQRLDRRSGRLERIGAVAQAIGNCNAVLALLLA